MSALGITLRALSTGAGLLIVGVLAMSLLAGPSDKPTARQWQRRLARSSGWLAVLVLLSGVAVLGWQVTVVTGRADGAASGAAWLRLLGATQLGTVWLLRHAILLLLAALVLFRESDESRADWLAWRIEAGLLAVAGAGLAAWAGHAVGVDPGSALPALVNAVHLAATGAWLGALPALALLLVAASREEGADSRPFAVLAVRRFSTWALAVMAVIVVTGVWNAWNEVGGVPGLVGTGYGRLVLLKGALLLPVLALAAWNRRSLLPRLGGDGATVGRPGMRSLARFVAVEAVVGAALVVVAAALALTPPGRHTTPDWPLSFRLAPEVTWNFPGVKTQVLIGAQILLVGLLALIAGCFMRRWRPLMLAGAAVLLFAGAQQALPPLAVDAYPTTYRRPSVPYNAASIAHGASLYRVHCVECHGPAGRGDGPASAGLLQRPADLTAPHTNDHTAGDIFWWLTHGVGIVMPGFGAKVPEDERWDLINFLRALSAGEAARSLTDIDEPERPRLRAPDFTFATGPAQTTLKDYRGRQPILLVLFTLPSSRARLAELAQAYGDLRSFNAAVLAVPMDGGERILSRIGASPRILFPVATEGAEDIVSTYSLFRRTRAPEGALPNAPMPAHMEFLIDRSGYLRARWLPGGPQPGWSDIKVLLAEIHALNQETDVAAPPDEHVH
ncbi:MAG: CopD family protein [Candidatus Rokubacteria bacterium]|nr:CopD family protein [Candidatus Rokubacteria bacterium]